jgi:hypothetical protein
MRTRSGGIGASVLLLASLLGTAASAQEWPHSVVIGVNASGRGLPPGSAGTVDSKRYWADHVAQAIRRSNLDGSQVEDLAGGLAQPYGLSYDSATDAILWTSSGDEVVQRLGLAGGTPTTLPCEFEEPYTILVDNESGHTAYALDGAEIVRITRRADGTGDEREVLATLSVLETLHGLALDARAGLLYLGDEAGQMTRRLRLAERRIEPLLYVEESFPLAPVSAGFPLGLEEVRP